MSTTKILTEHFIFTLYGTNRNLQLGIPTYANPVETPPHNGVIDSFVSQLEDAVIPSYVEGKLVDRLGYRCLRELPNLKFVFIPNTIKEIAADSFLDCPNLKTVIFEQNSQLSSISRYAFYSTGISSITFPPSLKTINGDYLFHNCPQLHTIVIQSLVTTDSQTIFDQTDQDVRILVPHNYPSSLFGTKNVLTVLPSFVSLKRCFTCQHNNHIHLVLVLFFGLFFSK